MTNFLKLYRNNLTKAVLGLTLFLIPVISFSQDTSSIIQEIAHAANVPAIQLNYQKDGVNRLYNIGFKNSETKTKIDRNTIFQAASLTKVIATYTFLRLMDQGLIELDKPLYSYYTYDRLAHNPNKDKITARHVLTHQTGLLNWEGDVPSEEWRKTALTSQFEAGTDYMYSGEGFYFLQETMEHITGKTFQQLVEEEVLLPFKMKNSAIVWQEGMEQNAAFGHYESISPRKLGMYRKSNAAYTLYTTAADYSQFIKKYIFEGFGLKKKTHELALKRISEAKKSDGISVDDKHVPCALGMRMQINEIGTSYWHTGSNPGFRCFFLAYPDSKEIVVAFTNSDSGFATIPHILALFLNNNQTFWMYKWRLGELD
ncbi:serine hydrolase domain-containing protein [Sphingobacterium daejeonense]|uniref:Serine hydrolase domain-containing protein n=1 Tax=Sphingobacterium daejeonense TaxID=371142 RepID=A0ABW3RGV4_9SPHI